jgi:hypothetical protein
MITRSFVCQGVRYQLEEQRCGRANCGRCPHGPYWRAYWWDGKKWRGKYVGKKLPPGVQPAAAAATPMPVPAPLSRQGAYRMLGINLRDSFLVGQTKWQALRRKAERRGDSGRAQVVLIDRAWEMVWTELD